MKSERDIQKILRPPFFIGNPSKEKVKSNSYYGYSVKKSCSTKPFFGTIFRTFLVLAKDTELFKVLHFLAKTLLSSRLFG